MLGPIQLDILAPYLEAGLQNSGLGVKVSIGGVRLGIDRDTHQLDLRAENVRLATPDGAPVANFPEMATSFGLGMLLHGRIAPTQLWVVGPVIHLLRDETGAVTARIGDPDDAVAGQGPGWLEQIGGAQRPEGWLGAMQRLDVRNATIIVDDRRTARRWHANRVAATLTRNAEGIAGDLSFALPIGNAKPEVQLGFRYGQKTALLDIDVAMQGLEPAALAFSFPELPLLQQMQFSGSGTAAARIDLGRSQPRALRVDLQLGKGRMASELLAGGALALEKGELHIRYAPEQAELRLEQIALDLGNGASLVAQGTVGGLAPDLLAAEWPPSTPLPVELKAALRHVAVDRFAKLWPPGLSPGGRRWAVANLHDGMLDEGAVQASFVFDPKSQTISRQTAAASLRYHDLTINYVDGLPPVRGTNGTATYTGNRLDFMPTSGALRGLKITGGLLRVSEIGTKLEWLTIDLSVNGPLRDALDVLDHKPLGYAHAIGIDPAQVNGRVEAQLHFKFPLLAELKLDQVDYGAKATASGVAIGKIALDRNLTEGNLALDLTRTGAHVQGTANLDAVPAKLDAMVYFKPGQGPRSVYRVALILNDEARRRFALDLMPERVRGSVGIDATYTVLDPTRSQAVVLADLRGLQITLAEAGWQKPADAPGSAKIVLDLEREKITRVPQIEVKAAGLDARLAVALSDGGKQIDRVNLQRVAVGGSDIRGTVTRLAGGGWQAELQAPRLDGRHLLKEAATDSGPASPVPVPVPLSIGARIDRLSFGPGREFNQVVVQLLRQGGIWRLARVDARFASGRGLTLRYGEAGSSHIRIQSEDLGALVKLLGLSDEIGGGRITLDGDLSQANGRVSLRGHIEGQDYSLVRAPVMARILALPSFSGVASLLSGSGIPFSILRGDIVYDTGQVTIADALAYGESLGITAKGWVDIERDRIELQGTVAPSYALNSMIGSVPIIGPLIGGGSQGLFAANFRVSGPTAQPQVSVNPLSALAPGFLRQLFSPLLGYTLPKQERRAAH